MDHSLFETPPTVDEAIARVRAYVRSKNWTKSRFAKEAGLPDTTLRHFDQPDWNPTSDTLRKLETYIAAHPPSESQDGEAA